MLLHPTSGVESGEAPGPRKKCGPIPARTDATQKKRFDPSRWCWGYWPPSVRTTSIGVLAVDDDAICLELVEGLLDVVVRVGGCRRLGGDQVQPVLVDGRERARHRLVPGGLVDQAERSTGPDELVDLVHLPQLMHRSDRERGFGVDRDVVDDRRGLLRVVAGEDPALDDRLEEPHRGILVGGVREPGSVGPQGVLEHGAVGVLVRDHIEVLRLVQLAGGRVHDLEDLRPLVVGHRLGRIHVAVQQGVHAEVLRRDRHRGRVEALGGHRREDLPLVAEAPRADPLALEVRDAGDAGVLERHLKGAGLLEHLRDVRELDAAGFEGAEHLRHPGDREVHVTRGERVLRHDVAAGGDQLDIVEALLLEVALVERDAVARELGLGQPPAAAP